MTNRSGTLRMFPCSSHSPYRMQLNSRNSSETFGDLGMRRSSGSPMKLMRKKFRTMIPMIVINAFRTRLRTTRRTSLIVLHPLPRSPKVVSDQCGPYRKGFPRTTEPGAPSLLLSFLPDAPGGSREQGSRDAEDQGHGPEVPDVPGPEALDPPGPDEHARRLVVGVGTGDRRPARRGPLVVDTIVRGGDLHRVVPDPLRPNRPVVVGEGDRADPELHGASLH